MPRFRAVAELSATVVSLARACDDWAVLRLPAWARLRRSEMKFAFLVHPRTEDFWQHDSYGGHDTYRQYPALRWLEGAFGRPKAEAIIRAFSRNAPPISLANIVVRHDGAVTRGLLLSSVRTPRDLFRGKGTRAHLVELFALAARKGARRVGLGALLPSLTRYGRTLQEQTWADKPAVSTGHGYTAHVIVDYLEALVAARSNGFARVAIVGAAGSTGTATARMIKARWQRPGTIFVLVDVPAKRLKLEKMAAELRAAGHNVATSTDLLHLRSCSFVIVVTNAQGAIVRPEHISPGTVVIDDSQPRNTAPEIVAAGAFVVDVLSKVRGLDCGFDFGFATQDREVTFTCLAETVLAAICGDGRDLAVGEVDDETVARVIELANAARRAGLVGALPFFSFGRELTSGERADLLTPPLPDLMAAD